MSAFTDEYADLCDNVVRIEIRHRKTNNMLSQHWGMLRTFSDSDATLELPGLFYDVPLLNNREFFTTMVKLNLRKTSWMRSVE
jgi:hypothetical protein